VGTVHHGNIIEPIRSFLSSGGGSSSATYLQANALHVDLDRKTVKVELAGDANLAPTVAADVSAISPSTTEATSSSNAGRWQWWPFFSKSSAQNQPNEASKSTQAVALGNNSTSDSKKNESSSSQDEGSKGAQADLLYDKLVIAVGARPATFGIPGVEEHAFFLKELDHSAVLQQRLLACLEQASALLALHGDQCKEAQKLLHFVVLLYAAFSLRFIPLRFLSLPWLTPSFILSPRYAGTPHSSFFPFGTVKSDAAFVLPLSTPPSINNRW